MDTSPGYRGALIFFAVLVIVWLGWLYFAAREADKREKNFGELVHTAPTISVNDIDKYCDTGKVVEMRLMTGDLDKFGQLHKAPGKPTPKALAVRVLRTWTVTRSRTGDTNDWQRVEQDPAEMKLFSPDHKVCVALNTFDVERGNWPTIFKVDAFDKFDLVLPDDWQKKALRKYSLKTGYKIVGIPCNANVFVMGALSKKADGYHISGFPCQGLRYNALLSLVPGQKYSDQIEVDEDGNLEQ